MHTHQKHLEAKDTKNRKGKLITFESIRVKKVTTFRNKSTHTALWSVYNMTDFKMTQETHPRNSQWNSIFTDHILNKCPFCFIIYWLNKWKVVRQCSMLRIGCYISYDLYESMRPIDQFKFIFYLTFVFYATLIKFVPKVIIYSIDFRNTLHSSVIQPQRCHVMGSRSLNSRAKMILIYRLCTGCHISLVIGFFLQAFIHISYKRD